MYLELKSALFILQQIRSITVHKLGRVEGHKQERI